MFFFDIYLEKNIIEFFFKLYGIVDVSETHSSSIWTSSPSGVTSNFRYIFFSGKLQQPLSENSEIVAHPQTMTIRHYP